MKYTIFDKKTGIICSSFIGDSIELQMNDLLDYVEGEFDSDRYYIENKEPILKPNKPDNWHQFDIITKQWIPIDNYILMIRKWYISEVNSFAGKTILLKYPYYKQLNNPTDVIMFDWINNIRIESNLVNNQINNSSSLNDMIDLLEEFIYFCQNK